MFYNRGDMIRHPTPVRSTFLMVFLVLFFPSPHCMFALSVNPLPLSCLTLQPTHTHYSHTLSPVTHIASLAPYISASPLLVFSSTTLLLIGLRVTLASPLFLHFGPQMKDLSLYM